MTHPTPDAQAQKLDWEEIVAEEKRTRHAVNDKGRIYTRLEAEGFVRVVQDRVFRDCKEHKATAEARVKELEAELIRIVHEQFSDTFHKGICSSLGEVGKPGCVCESRLTREKLSALRARVQSLEVGLAQFSALVSEMRPWLSGNALDSGLGVRIQDALSVLRALDLPGEGKEK